MPSFHALARDRSSLAALALAAAIAAGPAGLTSVALADEAPLPAPAPIAATPTPLPEATPAPSALVPTPTAVPAADPAASSDDVGPVGASAVVLPAPVLVPSAERIAPGAPGPSLRFVSAGHRLRTARLRTMNVKVDVADAASLRAWAILPGQAVKAAEVEGHHGDFTLARHTIRQPPSGRVTVKLQFDGPAQEALLRFYKVTVTVRLAATDANGHTRTIERPVELSD